MLKVFYQLIANVIENEFAIEVGSSSWKYISNLFLIEITFSC